MCMPHWEDLKKTIEDRGLMGLVASDGKTAVENLVSELQEGSNPQNYDPLMAAMLAIWANALKYGGLYLMSQDDQGNDYCPLCEAQKHGIEAAEWIALAADGQVEMARGLKLAPKIQ